MIIDGGARINNTAYTGDAQPKQEVKPKQVDQTPAENPVVQEQKAVTTQIPGQPEQKPNEENDNRKLKDAVNHANQTMRHSQTKCEFSYHEETKRVSIKVLDANTDEVIREIPAEETLEMLSKMWELAGLMVDENR